MKIAEVCVRRPVFAVMLIAFLVTLGIFSYRELGVDLFPRADPATVFVQINLPGASPEEMVSSVIIPLEDAISSVSGLVDLSAWTFEGSARIVATFVLEREIEGAAQDVREKVAGAMSRLPPGVLPPVIRKADPDSDPILTLLVTGPMSRRELTEIADKQIRRAIQTVDGVGEVSLGGAQRREIRILIDAERLTAHNLTVLDVRNAVRSENIEAPGGRVIHGVQDLGLRTLGRVTSSEQFADIILASRAGTPIRVRDVGRVEDGAEELRSWSSLRGQDVVSIEIRRQSGTNTVRVANQVKQRIATLERELPAGVELTIVRDLSVFIQASVNSLLEHLILGSFLAALVVLLFIRNLRAVIIAGLAIPTSIIATFTLMRYMDFTLNNMTLLALTLAVGIVIDDAIIVLENIFRYLEEKRVEAKRAAVEATREIGLAVMATTLSLVVIFLPVAFMTGYARRYVNAFGWTMAMAIMVSLLVSFTLTPMLSSRFLKVRAEAGHIRSRESKFAQSIESFYLRALNWALDHRPTLLLICVLTFASSFFFYQLVGRDWIPADDQSELNAMVTLPEGTALEPAVALVKDMTAKIEALPEVEYVNPGVSSSPSRGRLYVRLKDPGERKRNHEQVADAVRQILAGYRNITYNVRLPSTLGGEMWFPVRAELRGPDVYRLVEHSQALAERMREFPGLVDVNPFLNLSAPELQVKVDRQRAADLGVRMADISSTVRLMFSGQDEITTYKEGSEQYPVTMMLLPEQRDNPQVLARLMVPSARIGQVNLESVATIQRGSGPSILQRSNREFRVTVGANVAPGTPLDAAAAHTLRAARTLQLPPGYSFSFPRMSQVSLLEETTFSLLLAMTLASIFMYMVLAAQFESFTYPFIIMLTLPLSIPFALFSLFITGRSLSLWSALGVFLLLGIVKKNGILQVDYTNRLRASGLPLREAVVEANRVRLRPILMTTFSIIAGLIPVAIGIGAGSEQRASIAVTIIGGQALCLLLTLLLVPVAYSYLAELEAAPWAQRFGGAWGRLRGSFARLFSSF
jgi:HAE1 family hydrophobic/amphiphilic exporter-1